MLHFKWCFYCNVLHSHIHRCYRFVSQSIISSRLASSSRNKESAEGSNARGVCVLSVVEKCVRKLEQPQTYEWQTSKFRPSRCKESLKNCQTKCVLFVYQPSGPSLPLGTGPGLRLIVCNIPKKESVISVLHTWREERKCWGVFKEPEEKTEHA